jgi:hypothetical protein
MNNRSWWRVLAVVLVVIVGVGVVAATAYNAGVAHAVAGPAQALPTPPAGAQYVYVVPRHWGGGFFPFFPILLLVFMFFLVRALLWGGPWRGGRGCRYGAPPPSGSTPGGTT